MVDRFPLKYTGDSMLRFGLGTWKSEPSVVGEAVLKALKCGYRLIDCAACYGNEAEVGAAMHQAFTEGVLSRGELFVTSKLWNTEHAPEKVEPACRQTLKDLQLDYLDLYLIHWPLCYGIGQGRADVVDVPLEDTWKAMEDLVRKGLVRNIGLSNFTPKQIERICKIASIPPAVLQIEMHPLLQQKELRAICKEKRMAVTAYSTLGSNDSVFRGDFPNLLQHPEIAKIAEKHGKSIAQVILRWAYQEGVAIIPKSVKEERLKENLAAITDLVLDDEDMEAMRKLDCGRRSCGAVFFDGLTEEEFWNHA